MDYKDLRDIYYRIMKLPEDVQTTLLAEFNQKLDAAIDVQESLKVSCQTEGHLFGLRYDGWVDNSYMYVQRKNGMKKLPISTVLLYDKLDDDVRIRWSRTCSRCGYHESMNEIPEIVIKSNGMQVKKNGRK